MSKKQIELSVLLLFTVMSVLLYSSTEQYTGIAKTTSASYVKFLAIFVGVLCLAQFAITSLKTERGTKLHITDHWPRFLGLLAALIVFAILFEHLGFFVCAGIFIPAVALILGYKNYKVIAVTSVSVLVFVYLVFVTMLSVNLPGFNF